MEPSKVAEEFVLRTDMHLFLTGKAGTGKTTLLRKIANESDKNMVIVAPTGVAPPRLPGVSSGHASLHRAQWGCLPPVPPRSPFAQRRVFA